MIPTFDDEGCVWMLAYGANMCAEVLQQRRGLSPQGCAPARAPGWRLVFDQPGIPWLEPVFANIAPDPQATLHGVLWRLTAHDLSVLDDLEGGDAYHKVALTAHTYDGRTLNAIAYQACTTRSGERPSPRYLDILLRGATHHALDPAWIDQLRATPTAPAVPGSALLIRGVEALFRRKIDPKPLFRLLWRVKG